MTRAMKSTLWPFSSKPMLVRYVMTALLGAVLITGFIALCGDIRLVLLFCLIYPVFVSFVLMILLDRGHDGGNRWALTFVFTPVIVLCVLPAMGRTAPFLRLAVHHASYMRDVHALETLHPRSVVWDWTDYGGLLSPQVWLVFDEAGRVAGPVLLAGWQRPEVIRNLGCVRSIHLYGRFRICSSR